jgi:hypothetical protein
MCARKNIAKKMEKDFNETGESQGRYFAPVLIILKG